MTGGSLPPSKTRPPARTSTVPVCSRRSRSRARSASICCSVRCHHCGRAYVGTSAHGRNGRYTYYACSTRYKYGPSKCNGDRLPKDRLEAAVLAQLAGL